MHIWHLRACGAVCLNSPSLLLFWLTQILRSTVLRQKHVLYKHSTNPGSISVSCWPYFECNKFHLDLSGGWCEKNCLHFRVFGQDCPRYITLSVHRFRALFMCMR